MVFCPTISGDTFPHFLWATPQKRSFFMGVMAGLWHSVAHMNQLFPWDNHPIDRRGSYTPVNQM